MTQQPDILWLSIDSLRGDIDNRVSAPHLERFRNEGAVFLSAWAPASYTTTSHASVLTGLTPQKHGVGAFYHQPLDKRVTLFPEFLQQAGYETFLATDVPELFEPVGLTRGFDHVFSRDDHKLFSRLHRTKKPVFLLAHFFDVHEPYGLSEYPVDPEANDWYFSHSEDLLRERGVTEIPDSPYARFYLLRNLLPKEMFMDWYDRGVTHFDANRFAWWQERMERRFPRDRAYRILFGDHGEADYGGFFGHGSRLIADVLHVPLWISGPDIEPQTISYPVSLADLVPTLVERLHLPVLKPESFDGRSLWDPSPHAVYSEWWESRAQVAGRNPQAPPVRQEDSGTFVVPEVIEDRLAERRLLLGEDTALLKGEPDLSYWMSPTDFAHRIVRGLYDRFEESPAEVSAIGQEASEQGTAAVLARLRSERDLSSLYLRDGNPTGPEDPLIERMTRLHEEWFTALRPSLFPSPEWVAKERQAIEIIAAALRRFGPRLGVAFTGGKDSLVLLHMFTRLGFRGPVIHIDTSVKFPEIYAYRDRMVELWNLDLHVFRNDDALPTLSIAAEKEQCCHLLKTLPLAQAVQALHLEALATGVRRDETPARAQEKPFSPREDHMRIHPLVNFSEADIWTYIRTYSLPYCPLYDRGFRSLGCVPCTKPSTEGAERAGRSQDKEDIMIRLRNLGYF